MRATPFTAETVAVRTRQLGGITSVSVASAPGGWRELAVSAREQPDRGIIAVPPDVLVDD